MRSQRTCKTQLIKGMPGPKSQHSPLAHTTAGMGHQVSRHSNPAERQLPDKGEYAGSSNPNSQHEQNKKNGSTQRNGSSRESKCSANKSWPLRHFWESAASEVLLGMAAHGDALAKDRHDRNLTIHGGALANGRHEAVRGTGWLAVDAIGPHEGLPGSMHQCRGRRCRSRRCAQCRSRRCRGRRCRQCRSRPCRPTSRRALRGPTNHSSHMRGSNAEPQAAEPSAMQSMPRSAMPRSATRQQCGPTSRRALR